LPISPYNFRNCCLVIFDHWKILSAICLLYCVVNKEHLIKVNLSIF
jgi:hypothetical protein